MFDTILSGQIIQYLFTGLTIGAIYALTALGFNIIHNVTGIINFAQGDFVVWGGLLMVMFARFFGFPLPVAFFSVVGVMVFIGAFIYYFNIRPIKKPSILTMIMVTIAVSIILQGVAMFIWGKEPYALPSFIEGPPVYVYGAYIMRQSFWVLGISVAMVLFLTFFFNRTLIGKAMRACADDPGAAGLVGISTPLMICAAFMLGSALGAVGGAVITPITLMEYDRGAMIAIKGFGSAILGGLGSFSGAVIAGFMLGILESFATGFVSSAYKDAISLVLILGVLFTKPEGLFGSGANKKA